MGNQLGKDFWEEADSLLDSDISNGELAGYLGINESSVRKRRKKLRQQKYPTMHQPVSFSTENEEPPVTFSTGDREALHRKLDELLDQANTDPKSVKSMRVATWDAMHKDATHTAQKTKMYGVRLETARWAPSWPVVQPAAPRVVEVAQKPRLYKPAVCRTAVILPDTQIGYRQFADGTYDSFHDEKAIEVALQVTADACPDKVIFLGDLLDLPVFGKYEQEAAFARTTQKAIDYAYELLIKVKALVPDDCKIYILEGNHDRRIEKSVTRNAMEAFGLRRAGDTEGWPVLSVPHLLRLDNLGVQYVGGYPAGSLYINERIKCIHGEKVRSNGSTAKAVLDDERVSTIFGHVHRIETHYKTANVFGGGRTRLAHTPGCLCRIDGAVPSVHGSTTLDGRPVTRYEDWQQGLTIVSYDDGDSPFSLESVFINTMEGYTASYGGVLYSP